MSEQSYPLVRKVGDVAWHVDRDDKRTACDEAIEGLLELSSTADEPDAVICESCEASR